MSNRTGIFRPCLQWESISEIAKQLQAKLARIEAAGRELPDEPVVIVDSLVAGKQSFDWPLVEKVSYDKLRDYAAAQTVRAESLQAKIDALMLEYCPDEMTLEQVAEWGKHQKAIKDAP